MRTAYMTLFLEHNFVSGLHCTLKPPKPKNLFQKT